MEIAQKLLLAAPIFLFSVIAHEYAHGYVALLEGDRTAKDNGFLTWNPVKQIDPFFTVLMPLMTGYASNGQMIFGGAKGVPYDPRNFRHRVSGEIKVALAGVTANLLIAILCTVVLAAVGFLGRMASESIAVFTILQAMCIYGIGINLILVFFNLMPIPPLDGSKVFKYVLPARAREQFERFERFGLVILLALLFFGRGVIAAWMKPAVAIAEILTGAVRPLIDLNAWQWLR